MSFRQPGYATGRRITRYVNIYINNRQGQGLMTTEFGMELSSGNLGVMWVLTVVDAMTQN